MLLLQNIAIGLELYLVQVFRNILPNLTAPVLSVVFEVLRPEWRPATAVGPYRDVLRPRQSSKVPQIFNEAWVAVRRESATELENRLNSKQKGYWKLPVKFIGQGINISNHMVIHVNAHDLLDLKFIYIFIYSLFTGINLIHSFSILVQYFHWFTYLT